MKIIAFAASNSRQSINKKLVAAAAAMLKAEIQPDAEIEILDLNDFETPLFSVDYEAEHGGPAAAQRFFDKIGSADAVLASYAEHNGNYTAAFKNLYDWASRIEAKAFQGKPMIAMSTSPGRLGGANVLKIALNSAPHYGADIRASFSVPRFNDVFDDASGQLTDPEALQAMREALKALIR